MESFYFKHDNKVHSKTINQWPAHSENIYNENFDINLHNYIACLLSHTSTHPLHQNGCIHAKCHFRSVLLENRNKIEISFKYTRFCLLFKFSLGFSGFIEEQVSVKQSMLIIMTAHLDN